MLVRPKKPFFHLHSGVRAGLLGALAVFSAAATGGEVQTTSSPPPSDTFFQQVAVIQDAIGGAAESVGLPSPSATQTSDATFQYSPKVPAAKEVTMSGSSSSAVPASNKSSESAIPKESPSPTVPSGRQSAEPRATGSERVGEVGSSTALGASDEERDPGFSNTALNLPSVSDVGNLDQVVTALGPLTGSQPDSLAAFRPTSSFGSGSIMMPSTSGALSRDSRAGDLDALPLGQQRSEATFGKVKTFTMAKDSRGRSATSSDDGDSLKKNDEKKNDDKNKAKGNKKEEDKAKNDPNLQKQAEDIFNHNPFTQKDYEDFRDLVNKEFGKVQKLANSRPDLGSKALSLFDQFAPNPPDTADLGFKRLVDEIKRQQNDDFQTQLAPVSREGTPDNGPADGSEGEGSPDVERGAAPAERPSSH